MEIFCSISINHDGKTQQKKGLLDIMASVLQVSESEKTYFSIASD